MCAPLYTDKTKLVSEGSCASIPSRLSCKWGLYRKPLVVGANKSINLVNLAFFDCVRIFHRNNDRHCNKWCELAESSTAKNSGLNLDRVHF